MDADNTENTSGDGSESTAEETAAYDKEARMRAIEAAMNAASNRDTFEVADSSEMSLPDAESAGQDSADGYDPELAKQRLTALFEERDVLTQQRSADSKGTSSGVEGRRGKQGLNALSETLYNTNTNKDELKRELAMLEQSLSMKAMINHGTNVARALASLPPNVLHPGSYVTLLKALAAQHAWEFTEWTPEELRDLGCGAFYAVTQGNGPPNTR
jgi:leucyl aminopeptidase